MPYLRGSLFADAADPLLSGAPGELSFPPAVDDAFELYRTAELSTMAKDGTPITWPTTPFLVRPHGIFTVTTSPAFPQKVHNVERDPRVSLLYSDPTGTGRADLPYVLVQGRATASPLVDGDLRSAEEDLAEMFRRQPASKMYSAGPLNRRLFDFYYLRLGIVIVPERIRWWPRGTSGPAAGELEVGRAG